MTTTRNSLLAKISGGLSIAVLALAFSFGAPGAVRAQESEALTPAVQEMIVAFADSVMSQRLIVQQICIADENGAQTCIGKEKLDALLSSVSHAELAQPAVITTEAEAIEPEAPIVAAAPTDILPPAEEIASLPAEPIAAPAAEDLQADPEVEQTGSVNPESPGAAQVSIPEVETIIAVEGASAE